MRLLVALLLVLSTIGGAQTSASPRNRAEQQQGSSGKTGSADEAPHAPTPPSAPAASAVDQPTATTKQTNPQKEAQSILKKAFAPENWPHWALFGAALWAGYIALKTLRAIHQEAIEIKAVGEAAKSNADAAAAHAKIAEASTGTLKNIYRAWVLFGWKHGTEGGQFDFVFRNWGQTPAKIESAAFKGIVLPKDNFGNLPAPDAFSVPRMLAPSEPMPIRTVNAKQFAERERESPAVNSGAKVCVWYGIVAYRDVLDETILHETGFCYWYSPKQFGLHVGGPPEYNKAT